MKLSLIICFLLLGFTLCEGQREIQSGILRTWNKNDKSATFINYSVEENDTISYCTQNGHITILNLKDKITKIKHDSFAYYSENRLYYYHQEYNYNYYEQYLSSKITLHLEFDANGTLVKETHLKQNKKNGSYKEWYTNTALKLISNYINDTLDGASMEYYPDGKPKKQTAYVKGLRNGIYREYYENGRLMWNSQYNNGTLVGMPKAFIPKGSKIEKKKINYTDNVNIFPLSEKNKEFTYGIAMGLFENDTANRKLMEHVADSIYPDKEQHYRHYYMIDGPIQKALSKYIPKYETILQTAFAKDSNFVIHFGYDLHIDDKSRGWDTSTVRSLLQDFGKYYKLSFGSMGTGLAMGGTAAYLIIYKDMSCDNVEYPDYKCEGTPWYISRYWIW
jgi:antitoxin component YwqK of YwqJK toxin-antitoxin module